MADAYLLENGTGRYLLEDNVTPLLLEGVLPPVEVTPAPASAASSIINPSVVLESLTVIPVAIASVGLTLIGVVLLGSITIAPSFASSTASKNDPSILILEGLVHIGMTPHPMIGTRMTKMRGIR